MPPHLPGLAVAAAGGGSRAAPEEQPLFSFGLIADVQYADENPVGPRYYRTALAKLEECVTCLNTKELAFTVQLGDLIEYGSDNLDRALAVFDRLRMKKYHVLGNHDFCRTGMSRDQVLAKLGTERPYYDFAYGNWRFVILDGMDVSVEGGWPANSHNFRQGQQMLQELQQQEKKWAQEYNGAIGRAQLAWLSKSLQKASAKRQKVVLFCHLPTLAAASREHLLLWNHEEVLNALESDECVVGYFSGHDHDGGYAQRKGIHHVTLQGMVEAPAKNAYAVVDVYEDRLELRGTGKVPSRRLKVLSRRRKPTRKR